MAPLDVAGRGDRRADRGKKILRCGK